MEDWEENYLIQDIRGVTKGLRKGRNVFEGYQGDGAYSNGIRRKRYCATRSTKKR